MIGGNWDCIFPVEESNHASPNPAWFIRGCLHFWLISRDRFPLLRRGTTNFPDTTCNVLYGVIHNLFLAAEKYARYIKSLKHLIKSRSYWYYARFQFVWSCPFPCHVYSCFILWSQLTTARVCGSQGVTGNWLWLLPCTNNGKQWTITESPSLLRLKITSSEHENLQDISFVMRKILMTWGCPHDGGNILIYIKSQPACLQWHQSLSWSAVV